MQFFARSLAIACFLAGFAMSNALPVAAQTLGFSKAFSPDTVDPGEISRLTYTIDNTANAGAVGSLAFTDALPDGMGVAGSPNAATTCGGVFAPAEAQTSLAFSGGSVAAGVTCTISVDMQAFSAGTLTGTSGDLTSDLPDAAPGALATLTVREAPLSVSMSFSPPTIDQGEVSRLTYRLNNRALITAISFLLSDTLPPGVVVASVPNANDSCSGTLTAPAGGGEVSYSGGVVEVNESCMIAVDVTSAVAGRHSNETESMTSSLGTSTPAAATLTVNAAAAPGFSKAFSPATVDPGGESTLTFTIDNTANAIDVGSLAFTDDFPDGLVMTGTPNASAACGALATLGASETSLTFSDGSIGAGQTCTISVEVGALRAGTLENLSGDLTSDLPDAAPGASATLTVNEMPLQVRLSFLPSRIEAGGVSRLTYVLDNEAQVSATSVSLSDTLPTGIVVASEPNAATTCGGTLLAPAGGDEISLSGGSVNDTCTIAVDVTSAAAGSHPNIPESGTSSLGTSRSVETTLTVDAAAAPGFTKSFSPATVAPGGVSTLTFTIDNAANLIDVGSLAFDDDFPDGLAVADPPNGSTTCGGTFAPAASATALTFLGGRVGAGQSCTLSVDVRALRAGALTGISGDLTSDLPVATSGASATLTVSEAALVVVLSFSPSTIDQGGVSMLTYRLLNQAPVAATSVALSDTLPAGVVLADPPNAETTCAGGTLTAAAGGSEVSYSEGTVSRGRACTITVDVTSAAVGSHPNDAVSATSSLGTTGRPTPATLTVDPAAAPGFARVFSPDTIPQGGETEIVFTVDNTANTIAMTGMAFDDSLPPGVSVADTPGAVNGCGGTFNPVAGATTLSFADGVLAAGATCELRVTVRATGAGTLTGPAVALTSSIATATAVEAMLTVEAAVAPGFTKSFSPDTVDPGEISRLTFTIDNAANLIDVGGLAFTDAFPDGLAVAGTPNGSTTCGGTFAPAEAATSLAFSGGSVAAGETCTVSVDVVASRAGALTGTSDELTSDLPVAAPGASATLTVREAPLSASMWFSPSMIVQGGVSRLTYALSNRAVVGATSVSLSDTLPPGVVVADPPNAVTVCAGGTVSAPAGGGEVSYSGGSVGVSTTCTTAVNVTSAAAGRYSNVTESVTSSLGTSAAASATLTVDPAAAPGFSKAFSPATVEVGEISRLTFTIDNAANLIDVGGLAFDDDFPDGLAVAGTPNGSTTCGGTFAPAVSATSLAFSGGSVAAGQTCTISVDVLASRAGALTSTSGDLTSDLPVTTPGASATLTVNGEPLSVSMSFSPSTIGQGRVSRLTYGLDNGAAVAAASVSLSDSLPAGVVLADPPDAETTCAGGTLTAAAGGSEVSYSGGSLAAGAACTIAVDVTSVAVGSHPNDMASVTSSLGTSTPAEATLTVDPAAAPGFAKAFSPATVDVGGISTLTYTIDNSVNAIEVGSLAFTDSLPSGVVTVVTTFVQSVGCGGLTVNASGRMVSVSRGTVAAGGTCAIPIDVQAVRPGTLSGTSGELTSDLPDATPGASATLTVNEVPLSVSMSFDPSSIGQGEVARLTYELRNDTSVAAISVALSDTLPAGVVLADPPNVSTTSCEIDTLTAEAGGSEVSWSGGGVVEGGDTCVIAVDVTSTAVGSHPNDMASVTSSLGTSTVAEATLTVEAAAAPVFSKTFSPTTIDRGGTSRLTLTIDNTANAIDVGSLGFADNFPSGMLVARPRNASNTCGGTLGAIEGFSWIQLSEGAVAAGRTCRVSVDVHVLGADGELVNTTNDLTSDLPVEAPGASATLTVNPAALSVSTRFEPAVIGAGGVSRLIYELRNVAPIKATSVSLTDTLPAGVVLADPPDVSTTLCEIDTLTAEAGGSEVSWSGGGAVEEGDTCVIAVDVTSTAIGSHLNDAVRVSSELGASTPAEATLMVEAAVAPVFSKAFSPDTIDPGGASRLTFTIDNSVNAIEVGSLAFTDDFPRGLAVAGTPNGSTTCGGTFAPAASATSLVFSGGSVAAGQSCTLAVDVVASRAGALTSTSSVLTSDLPVAAPGASATPMVTEVPLSVSMSFVPATIDPGEVSRLTYDLNNGAAVAAAEVALSDTLPAGVVLADPPDARTTCAGGTLTAAAGGGEVSYSDGTLGAGEDCAISVDVTSAAVVSHPNDTESVTSTLGTSTPASAALTVNEVTLSVSMGFEPAAIRAGGVSRLTYELRSEAAIGATEVSLFDRLPADVVLADPPDARTTCAGGTLTATRDGMIGGGTLTDPGSARVAYSDGTLAAGAACTIAVDVTSAVPGSHLNDIDVVGWSLGEGGTAAATLMVEAAVAPGFAKAFSRATVDPGEVSTLTYTIDNTANAIEVGSLAFTDDFQDGLAVAGTPNASTTCGGTFAPAASATSLAFSGGRVGAGQSCTLPVDVVASRAGALTSTSSELTSDLPVATPGVAATPVEVNEAPLSVSISFIPPAIRAGGVSRLTYELRNEAAIGASLILLSDTLPAGVVLADPPDASDDLRRGHADGGGGRRRSLLFGRRRGWLTLLRLRLHGRRRRDLRGRRKLSQRHGERDLVSGRQHVCLGDVDGRSGGCAVLFQGVLPGHGRSGRGLDADLHHRQCGQRHCRGLSRLHR